MSAQLTPIKPIVFCPTCGQACFAKPPPRKRSGLSTIAALPISQRPWIAINFDGILIFANEEWSPFYVDEYGKLTPIEAHYPTNEDAILHNASLLDVDRR